MAKPRNKKKAAKEILEYYTALDRVSVLLNLHGVAIDECLNFGSIRLDKKAKRLWDEAQIKLSALYQHLGHKWTSAEENDLTQKKRPSGKSK